MPLESFVLQEKIVDLPDCAMDGKLVELNVGFSSCLRL